MLSIAEYRQGLRSYIVIEPLMVVADIEARIRSLTDGPTRKTATTALGRVRARLKLLDLSDCGWPPRSGHPEKIADLLHADSQKLVSAVLRVDHKERKVTILKYVLKAKR